MKNRGFGAAFFFLGLLVLLAPRYILPVCEYSIPGHGVSTCSYMGRAEWIIGFIAMGLAIGVFFSKSADALRWLSFGFVFVSAAVLGAPAVIGYCASPRMPCHYGTVPLLRLLGGIMLLASMAGLFAAREKKK